RTRTRAPWVAASIAAARPDPPAPITSTSTDPTSWDTALAGTQSPIDENVRSCHESARRRSEVDSRSSDVLWRSDPAKDRITSARSLAWIGYAKLLQIAFGGDRTRRNGVDTDALGTVVDCHGLGHHHQRSLLRAVCGAPGR